MDKNRMSKGKENHSGKAAVLLCAAVLAAVCIGLAGCGSSGDSARTQNPQSSSPGVDDVLQAGVEEYDKSGAQGGDETAQSGGAQASDDTGTAQSGDVRTSDNTDSVQAAGDSNHGTPAANGAGAGTVPAQSTESSEDGEETAGAGEVDVDLTAMSATIVYSEVFNMLSNPDKYIGKTVRMEGPCSIYTDESSGISYYACIIQDATACCAQGMEFELDETYDRPGDYPGEGEEVVVEGIFDTYEEGEYLYCTLRNARLIGE